MKWKCLFGVVLSLGLGAAPVGAQNTNVPVRLLSAHPAKILYGVSEPVAGTVVISNVTGTVQSLAVRAWLEWELDAKGKPQETKLTVQPNQTATATFKLGKPSARYGHAFKAEVRLGNQVVASGEDYFNVCDNYWNVSLIAAMSLIWQQFDKFEPRPDMKWARETIDRWRGEYFNGFEKFFWAPDDFLELTPDKEIWWSGQARYLETKKGLQTLIAEGHEQGLRAITYAKLTGGGTYGNEMARRHPEWVWNYGGTLSVDRNAKQIAEWDITTTNHWSGWVAVNYNMNDPKVVDIGIRELIDSATMFGWDGARWDGNFDVAGEVYDLEGNLVEKLNPEQRDERNAENMRRTKAAITKRHPQFVYGYNWTQGNWAQSMATNPRESIELARGGGLIMNEYINQAASVQHPLHRWEVYGPSVADDVEAIKKLGGYYGPILSSDNTADGRYSNIFAYAAGAHPYYHHLWGAFMTRYGTFCWDNALVRVKDASLVAAPDTVWWRHWVFERPLDKSHKQIIVHLINPPAKPTVGEGKKPEDVPPPVKNVTVRVLSGALSGWTVQRATRLSPEPWLKEAVPVQTAGGEATLAIPEVALWNILVIDLEAAKGGK